ncbi:MAG: biotin--[acetyl-CoA-carboxylase] ligase [Planctomycetes bacterium]|nr:biotin--[acetyl-CoA-carboxylase] ligase [Planctomycetota bacterium]
MTNPITREALEPLLRTEWLGRNYETRSEVDSTNSLAARLGEAGAAHGLVVSAESQTKGRGRMRRVWHSPAGMNLYFSILLRPQWDLQACPPLSIAAGVAIAEAVAQFAATPELKWPNDVLCNGRKLAGVLVEATAQQRQIRQVVLGIGVNVNQSDFPAELEQRATSLYLMRGGAHLDRAAVLARLLQRLEFWIDQLALQHGGSVIERWTEFAPWLGTAVRVTHGNTTIAGTAIALESNGALRLRNEQGEEQLVHCGDASGVMGWAC